MLGDIAIGSSSESNVRFFIAYHTGWMPLSIISLVLSKSLCWQHQALISNSAANLSFSYLLVFGSVIVRAYPGLAVVASEWVLAKSELFGRIVYLIVFGSDSDNTCGSDNTCLSRIQSVLNIHSQELKNSAKRGFREKYQCIFFHYRSFSRELAVSSIRCFHQGV